MPSPGGPAFDDVRMRGFRQRTEVSEVLALIEARTRALPAEALEARHALGRVLAEGVCARLDVPGFDRSAVDGYALAGAETFGANEYSPLEFRVVGQSLPARPAAVAVGAGEAVRIMTGAPLPAGADAVVMAEHTRVTATGIEVTAPVTPGRHVGRRGEDVARGALVLDAGRRVRPQDLGLLVATGTAEVEVVRRPRVGILVTGDEVAAPEAAGLALAPHMILDADSPMLEALALRDGAELAPVVRARDESPVIRAHLTALAATCDLVLVTGGSSVGAEDHAPALLAELGELVVHGVALRPASPSGVGFIGGVPVFLMPGNPVSCLCAYEFFAGPTIRRLGGRPMAWPHRRLRAPLVRKITSELGRVDYVRVRLLAEGVEPIATSGASILSSTTRADGVVLVPAPSEGMAPGEMVEVLLYD